MKEPEGKNMLEKIELILTELKDLELKNEEVFKAEIPSEDKLPLGPDFFNPITALDQPHIFVKI